MEGSQACEKTRHNRLPTRTVSLQRNQFCHLDLGLLAPGTCMRDEFLPVTQRPDMEVWFGGLSPHTYWALSTELCAGKELGTRILLPKIHEDTTDSP